LDQNSISLVISTFNDGIFRIPMLLPLPFDEIVIVHQHTTPSSGYAEVHRALVSAHCKLIPVEGRGLSASRNMGISAATSAYILIADDDLLFSENIRRILQQAFQELPYADIITFKVKTPAGDDFKQYAKQKYKHTGRSIAKVSSVEICIKKAWWEHAGIRFDERFGLGAAFETGEEYIFLHKSLQRKAQAWYYPADICVHPPLSSGRVFQPALLEAKGAMLGAVYGPLSPFAIVAFAWKKRSLFPPGMKTIGAIRLMMRGSRKYNST